MTAVAEWYVILYGTVSLDFRVEAEDRQEAQQKAVEMAKKRPVPRPHSWTPVGVTRADRKGPPR